MLKGIINTFSIDCICLYMALTGLSDPQEVPADPKKPKPQTSIEK